MTHELSNSRPGLARTLQVTALITVMIAAGLGPISISRAARAKTKLSIAAFPALVDPGASTTITGRVRSSRAGCTKRVKVTLSKTEAGASRKVATKRTNRKGNYAFDIVLEGDASFRTSSAASKACRPARSKALAVEVSTPPPPMLPGAPATPAVDNIPDASFPAPHPDEIEFSDEVGTIMSTTEFVLAPKPGATVAQINQLLVTLDAEVIGGNPEIGWVLVRLHGDPSAEETLAKIEAAEADPAIDLAVPEVVLEGDRVPGPDPNPVDPPGPATTPQWTWTSPPRGGNWFLEATRAPQSWNLLDELGRSQVFPGLVADIDNGFDVAHPDLAGKVTLETLGMRNTNPPPPNPLTPNAPDGRGHGTATAGIIAARFHNYRFLDGVTPVLELEDGTNLGGVIGLPSFRSTTQTPAEVAACNRVADAVYCFGAVFAMRLIDDFARLRQAHPEIRIYTNSMGFGAIPCAPQRSIKWRASGVAGTPAQQAAARRLVVRTARAFERVFPDVNARERSVIWFGSAGNDSDISGTRYPLPIGSCPGAADANGDGLVDMDLDGNGTLDNPGSVNIDARYSSPACAAALQHNIPGIFCVEATSNTPGYPRSDFSNVGGNMSAPGHQMATLATTSKGLVAHPTSGTSFATPLAAGIANFVDIFGNRGAFGDRPEQELTTAQLFDHLGNATSPGVGRAPMIDLFYALTTLDLTNNNHYVQRALVDVDDGSRFDGNARADKDDEDNDGNTNEPYPEGIATADGTRGDGKINMKDFRAFRDALLTTSGLTGALPLTNIALDGPPNGFKDDLNYDGCVDRTPANFFTAIPPFTPATDCTKAPAESIYPRYDFNGDGVLNGLSTSPPAGEVAPFLLDPATQCIGLNNPGGCVRDIDVLAEPDLWDDFFLENVAIGTSDNKDCTDPLLGWQPKTDLLQDEAGNSADLPDGELDYVLSADLHFKVDRDPTGDMDHVYIDVDSELPPNGSDDDGDGKVDEPFEDSFQRCYDIGPSGGKALVTVPLFTRHVLVTVVGEDVDLNASEELTQDPYGFRSPETGSGATLDYGQDVVYEVKATT